MTGKMIEHYVAMYMCLGMDLDDPLLALNNWEKA